MNHLQMDDTTRVVSQCSAKCQLTTSATDISFCGLGEWRQDENGKMKKVPKEDLQAGVENF